MNKEQLAFSASNFGFSAEWVADILEKYGPEVLTWAIDLARNGLSIGLITEVLSRFGPWFLDFLATFLNKQNMAAYAAQHFSGEAHGEVITGELIQGVDSNFISLIVEKYLPVILQQYLPVIIEKYGPQLIQLLLDSFLKNLQK